MEESGPSLLPFSGFVDLEDLKKALLCLAVDPSIGGLLILGPKGTGKSTLVRAFADLLPTIDVILGCQFGCDPQNTAELCEDCSRKLKGEGTLQSTKRKMRITELPIGVTDDRVVGSINVEQTLKDGRIHFETGILARAHRNVLYIDEVNLLPDHIVDLILDAAAYGWTTVEREGISLRHPSRFILIGTMNPEEGELRPQLLDRFAVSVAVQTVLDPSLRAEIVKRNIEFETNQLLFADVWRHSQQKLQAQVANARPLIREVLVGDETINAVSQVCGKLSVDGYRPDIVAAKIARSLAALDGRKNVSRDDALLGLKLALGHRTRAGGLKPPANPSEIEKLFDETKTGTKPEQPPSIQAEFKTKAQFSNRPQKQGLIQRVFGALGLGTRFKAGNPDQSRPRRRRISTPKFLFMFFFVFILVRLAMTVPLMAFLYLLLFFGTLLLVLLLPRKMGGTIDISQSNSQGMAGKRAQNIAIATIVSWPHAKKVFGKKISEGQQLLEERFETDDKQPNARFDLSKVLSRSRWLGRRKGIKGEGRPVAYRALDQHARADVSLSTSLRFAALRGPPLRIRRDDLKANIREGRIKASLIFVLDTSESMIDSLSRVRDAIRSIRRTASRMRDRVGLVVFKGEDAQVIQHPSSNFNLVLMKLSRVGLSDFTPLSAGMYRGIRLAHVEQARGYSPIFVIASDGVTNVSTARIASSIHDVPDPATDSLMMANMIANKKWRAIIANMAHAVEGSPIDLIMGTQLMMEIAKVTRGIYVGFPQKEGTPIMIDMSRGISGGPIVTSLVDSILH